MQKAIEDYILAKKTELAEQEKTQQEALLLREGLYEKEYGNFAFYEANVDSDENGIYKKIPLEISNEEYAEIQKYLQMENTSSANNTESSNRIATALTVIAILDMIAGLICGFVFGIDWSGWWEWEIILPCWFGGIILGIFTLGFAEIIKLLQRIADKK